jgi:hypothetical protein
VTPGRPLPEERRRELRRRYLGLGLGELAAAAVFVAVAFGSVGPRLGDRGAVALTWALVPLVVVLVPAGTYWLAARRWVGRGTMPVALARTYSVLAVVDAVLLLVALVGVVVWMPDSVGGAVLVLALWAFAVAEWLNYFVVRLAYPASQWFSGVASRQRPRLVQDVATAGR